MVKLPEKSPPHFTNLKPLAGATVTVTCVPSGKKRMLVFAPGRIKEHFHLELQGNHLTVSYLPPDGFPRPEWVLREYSRGVAADAASGAATRSSTLASFVISASPWGSKQALKRLRVQHAGSPPTTKLYLLATNMGVCNGDQNRP